jgi:NTE family protein
MIIGAAAAAPRASREVARPKKIGLVLAGGGALGMAHVGVLKVLEANRIPIHFVTGTSMGSIVGAAYASGATVPEMERILSETDWDALFDESLKRQHLLYRNKSGRANQIFGSGKLGLTEKGLARFTGVVGGQKVLPLLQRLYYRTPGEIDFNQLPIPFRAIAADVETGQPITLASGDLARAARASMAVPGFFTPVEIDGKALVDGGIANNLPVDIALEMGAEQLIVVDLMADLKTKEELGSLLGISGQIISLLLEQNSKLQRKLMRPEDVLLLPELKGYSATDFLKAQEIFAKGEAAANQNLAQLKRLSVSEAEYTEFQKRRAATLETPIVITALEVTSNVPAINSEINREFESQIGAPLDPKTVEELIESTYALGQLSSLEYRVDMAPDGKTGTLELEAKKASWYDKYLQAGMSIQDDFQGDSAYQLALGARFNDLNQAGAFLDTRLEIGWRPLAELDYYQPLAQSSDYFINPIGTYDRYQVPIRVDGEDIAEYQRSRFIAGVGLGRRLGVQGEMQVGVRRGTAEINRDIGDPSLPEGSYEVGNYFGAVAFDSRDTPDFPLTGGVFNFEAAQHTETLGSSDNFTQITGAASKPVTFGANTVLFSTDYGVSFQTIPGERVLLVGGMFDLSGFQPGGLTASDFFIARTAYYRELASLGGTFAKLNLFGGTTAEWATLRSDISIIEDMPSIYAGSLFVGADTPLVPIYFSFGLNSESEHSFYLNFGRIFKARR